MNKQRILKGIKSGEIYRDILWLLRLKTPYPLVVYILSIEYGATPQQFKVICNNILKQKTKEIRFDMGREKRKEKTWQRNQTLMFRFYDLYEKDRIRLDDVIKQVAKEFFLSENKIVEIIRGGIATGEIPLSESDTIKRFNRPHRKEIEDQRKQEIVNQLKREYEQATTQ